MPIPFDICIGQDATIAASLAQPLYGVEQPCRFHPLVTIHRRAGGIMVLIQSGQGNGNGNGNTGDNNGNGNTGNNNGNGNSSDNNGNCFSSSDNENYDQSGGGWDEEKFAKQLERCGIPRRDAP